MTEPTEPTEVVDPNLEKINELLAELEAPEVDVEPVLEERGPVVPKSEQKKSLRDPVDEFYHTEETYRVGLEEMRRRMDALLAYPDEVVPKKIKEKIRYFSEPYRDLLEYDLFSEERRNRFQSTLREGDALHKEVTFLARIISSSGFERVMKCYEQAILNYESFLAFTKNLPKAVSELPEIAAPTQSESVATDGLYLESFLILPIQRPMRHKMMVDEMVKLSVDRPAEDIGMLLGVQQFVGEKADQLNEAQRRRCTFFESERFDRFLKTSNRDIVRELKLDIPSDEALEAEERIWALAEEEQGEGLIHEQKEAFIAFEKNSLNFTAEEERVALTLIEKREGLTLEEKEAGLTLQEKRRGLTLEEKERGMTVEQIKVLKKEKEERLRTLFADLSSTKKFEDQLKQMGFRVAEGEAETLKKAILPDMIVNSKIRAKVGSAGVKYTGKRPMKTTRDCIRDINKTIDNPDTTPSDMQELLGNIGIEITDKSALNEILRENRKLHRLLLNSVETIVLTQQLEADLDQLETFFIRDQASIPGDAIIGQRNCLIEARTLWHTFREEALPYIQDCNRLILDFPNKAERLSKDRNWLSQKLEEFEKKYEALRVERLQAEVNSLKEAKDAVDKVSIGVEDVDQRMADIDKELAEIKSEGEVDGIIKSAQKVFQGLDVLREERAEVNAQIEALEGHIKRVRSLKTQEENWSLDTMVEALTGKLAEKRAVEEKFKERQSEIEKAESTLLERVRAVNETIFRTMEEETRNEKEILDKAKIARERMMEEFSEEADSNVQLTSLQMKIVAYEGMRKTSLKRQAQLDFWKTVLALKIPEPMGWDDLQARIEAQKTTIEEELSILQREAQGVSQRVEERYANVAERVSGIIERAFPFTAYYTNTLDTRIFKHPDWLMVQKEAGAQVLGRHIQELVEALEEGLWTPEGKEEKLERLKAQQAQLKKIVENPYPDLRPDSENRFEITLRGVRRKFESGEAEFSNALSDLEEILKNPAGRDYLIFHPEALQQFRRLHTEIHRRQGTSPELSEDPIERILMIPDTIVPHFEALFAVAKAQPLCVNAMLADANLFDYMELNSGARQQFVALEAMMIEQVASALTAKSRELFLNISISGELKDDGQVDVNSLESELLDNKVKACGSLQGIVQFSERVENLIVMQILSQESMTARAEVWKNWIEIANRCREKGDLHSALLISSMLNRLQSNYLRQTPKMIPGEVVQRKEEIDILASPAALEDQKKAFIQTGIPVIPPINVYLGNFEAIEEVGGDKRSVVASIFKEQARLRGKGEAEGLSMEQENVQAYVGEVPEIDVREIERLANKYEPRGIDERDPRVIPHPVFSELVKTKPATVIGPDLSGITDETLKRPIGSQVVLSDIENKRLIALCLEKGVVGVTREQVEAINWLLAFEGRKGWKEIGQGLEGILHVRFEEADLREIKAEIVRRGLSKGIQGVLGDQALKAKGIMGLWKGTKGSVEELEALIEVNPDVAVVSDFLCRRFGVRLGEDQEQGLSAFLAEKKAEVGKREMTEPVVAPVEIGLWGAFKKWVGHLMGREPFFTTQKMFNMMGTKVKELGVVVNGKRRHEAKEEQHEVEEEVEAGKVPTVAVLPSVSVKASGQTVVKGREEMEGILNEIIERDRENVSPLFSGRYSLLDQEGKEIPFLSLDSEFAEEDVGGFLIGTEEEEIEREKNISFSLRGDEFTIPQDPKVGMATERDIDRVIVLAKGMDYKGLDVSDIQDLALKEYAVEQIQSAGLNIVGELTKKPALSLSS